MTTIKYKHRRMQQGKSVWRVSFVAAFFVTMILAEFQDASAGTLYAVRGTDDHLVSIDTDTFFTTDIGALGVDFSFGGLGYDPNSDTLYMVEGRGADSLYTVNRNTGAATLVGVHGINDLFALAFDSTNNVLYAGQYASPDGLYSMNTITGAANLIGATSSALTNFGGLAYDSLRDRLVAMDDGDGDLYEINRATAAATLLFDGPSVNDSGLAYDNDKDLYWDFDYDGNLRSYDPNSGFTSTLEADFGGTKWDGLTYLSSIPEPTTLTLATLSLLAIVYRPRSHRRC